MILSDVQIFLASDPELLTLLGGDVADPRIYPVVAPKDTNAPFMILRSISDGSRSEILDDMKIAAVIITDNALDGENISERLKDLLDLMDAVAIPSDDYFIYWAKHIDGSQIFEPDTQYYNRAQVYALKFKRKV